MKPLWIIENITKEESYQQLAAAVQNQGFDLLNLNGDFSYDLFDSVLAQPVIFSGCIPMTKLVTEYLNLKTCFPIAYSNWQKYLCTAYYPVLSEFLFNDNYVFVPLGEVKRRPYFFYGIFGKESSIFLRPDDGDKSFKGGLVDIQDFDKVYDPALKNELAVVSTPKNIIGEWRFIVSRFKEIIAYSSYRYQGLITRVASAPKGAIELCQKILDVGYFPDSVFCIDIVQDGDGNFWLMELNSFSSAGLYACDKEKIVKRVSEIVMMDWDDFSRQQRF